MEDSNQTTKKVLLALNPQLYEILKQKADKRLMGVQELVYELLRKSLLAPEQLEQPGGQKPKKKSNAGRPPKVDDPLIECFSRKR